MKKDRHGCPIGEFITLHKGPYNSVVVEPRATQPELRWAAFGYLDSPVERHAHFIGTTEGGTFKTVFIFEAKPTEEEDIQYARDLLTLLQIRSSKGE